MTIARPPLPPFDFSSATLKVRAAENAWNNKNPEAVSLAYSPDSEWRNRVQFINGRVGIVDFLTKKWANELYYKLVK
jgi:nuclear transport factor 2 (NTF2) superfamily protein